MSSRVSKSSSVDILDVRVDKVTMAQALDTISTWVSSDSHPGHYIVKPYVEFIMGAQSAPKLQAILNQADLSVADGVSLQWAASFLYGQSGTKPTILGLVWSALWQVQRRSWRERVIVEKFAGVNFTAKLLKLAEQEGWTIGILGGPRDILRTKAGLQAKFPKLVIGGVWSGYTPSLEAMAFVDGGEDDQLSQTLAQIKEAQLDILFVAMGFPRQELFIDHYHASLGPRVMIGEGGSFDYDQLGGAIKRAPQLVRRLSLEWLWRLILQPSRIKRQLAVPKFTWAVYRQARQRYNRVNQEK